MRELLKVEEALTKAEFIELKQDFSDEKDGGQKVKVQFNPESLKVTFTNQLVEPKGGNPASGNGGRQFVGAGTTKLALQLWFDVNVQEEGPVVDDVRRKTQEIEYFMTAQSDLVAPPGVRFRWGTFIFDGMIESMDETIEFFSPDGKPLRASISLTLSQQKILVTKLEGEGKAHKQLNLAKAGDSLQSMAEENGKGNWQSIAAANYIEDPLRLVPGQMLDLNAGVSVGMQTAGTRMPVGAAPNIRINESLGARFGVNYSGD